MTSPAKLALALCALLPIGTAAQPPPYPPVQSPPSGATSGRQPRAAPRFELVGLAGYHVASDLDLNGGSASVDGSESFGAALRARIRPNDTLELLWVIVPTDAQFRSTSLGAGEASLTINYFQIGGTTGIRIDRAEPYLAGSLGAALLSPGTLALPGGRRIEGDDVLRFAFTIGGGVKLWLAERVALQLEARMLAPVWFSSAAFFAGSGGGAFAVSGGIPIVEGNFTGGLVLGL
jgi:hypothetical protein